MFYVYILQSKKDHKLYVGSTNDLERRFHEHNSGKVFSTKLRTPFELIYYEAYKSEKDCRTREKNLKLRANALSQLKRRIQYSLGVGV
jgi:putative endonuclease